MKTYILKGICPVEEPDLKEWAKWWSAEENRRVAFTKFWHGFCRIRISTMFIGTGDQLFETMIFGGKHDLYRKLSSSWEEAEQEHKRAVAIARS
jgi:hypothetical protein